MREFKYYLLIAVIGMVPLAYLAANSTLFAITSRQDLAEASDRPNLDEVISEAESLHTAVDGELPFFKALADAVAKPYTARLDNTTGPAGDLAQQAAQQWRAFEAARQLVRKATALGDSGESQLVKEIVKEIEVAVDRADTIGELEELLALLTKLIKLLDQRRQDLELARSDINAAKANTVAGTDNLLRKIDDELLDISDQLRRWEAERDKRTDLLATSCANENFLADARQAVSDERYDDALDILRMKIVEPVPEGYDELLGRCQLLDAGKQLYNEAKLTLNSRQPIGGDLVQKIQRFVDVTLGKPTQLQEQGLRQNLVELLGRLVVKRAENEVERLAGTPNMWPTKCKNILAPFDGPSSFGQTRVRDIIRELIAEKLRNLMALKLKPKTAPHDGQKQEAVNGNGVLIEGYFVGFGLFYKYWQTEQAKKNGATPRSIGAGELNIQPRTPLPVTAAQEYNISLTRLRSNPLLKSEWETYLASVQAIDDKLTKYRQDFGATIPYTLGPDISYAKQIVDEWDKIEPLLRGPE